MQRKRLVVILILIKFLTVSQSAIFNCGRNTIPVSGCVSICQPTCAVPLPKICPDICVLNGCVCKRGYVRSKSISTPCIPRSKCPKLCSNEPHTIDCGPYEVPNNSPNTCEPACDNPRPISCPLKNSNTPGCQCAKDYIRRDSRPNSPCILISQCPCTDCQ